MYEFQTPLQIEDFSGGITDFYVQCPITQYQKADNYLVSRHRRPKLESRDGTKLYDTTLSRITDVGRIGAIGRYRENLSSFIALTGQNIYTYSSLVGWVDNSDSYYANFSHGDADSIPNFGIFQNQMIATNTGYSQPYRVSDIRMTVGLPSVQLQGAIRLANDLKSKLNAHLADASAHTTAIDSTNTITAADAIDIYTLYTLVVELRTNYGLHDDDAELGSGWSYHAAQEASDHSIDLSPENSVFVISGLVERLDDLKTKINAHISDTTTHGSASTTSSVNRNPQVDTSGSANYTYLFVYFYEYEEDGKIYAVRGPTYQVEYTSRATSTKSITEIPELTDGTIYNWYQVTTIPGTSRRVEVYRTTDGGSTFYYVGATTGTTFSDTLSDSTLQNNRKVYTDGGVLDNDLPPRCRFVHVVGDYTYYGAIYEDASNINNKKFIQSKVLNPNACPGSFADEVNSDITGINSISVYPLIFERRRITRIEGNYTNTGQGNPQPRDVSDTVGSVSHNGIVQIPGGLVFPGEDAFYFTDGYSVRIISRHLRETYKNFVSQTYDETNGDRDEQRIYGHYDRSQNRVFWCVRSDKSSSDNDSIFVLDLEFGLTEESTFTTFTSNGWKNPTSMAFINGSRLLTDSLGYLYEFKKNYHSDPFVDVDLTPSSWGTRAIRWDYVSGSYDFGSNSYEKFSQSTILEAVGSTKSTIQIQSSVNNDGDFSDLREIRFRDAIVWGDPDIVWGSTARNYKWNVTNVIQAKRRFPAGKSKFFYRQMRVTNAYCNIYRSDDYDTVTIDATNRTVTLASGSWPTDILEYFLTFDDDSYATQFEIESRDSSSQVTVRDPLSELSSASGVAWYIKGYRKEERLNMISLAIPYALINLRRKKYRGETLENA